jgi:hypothetical protein
MSSSSRVCFLGLCLLLFSVSVHAAVPVHQWSQRFGDTATDWGNGVSVDASDNVIVTGTFNGTVNFGGGNLVSAGGADIFVANFSAGGVHQWSQRFGGTGGDFAYAIAVDDSNNVIVTGYFNDTVDFGGGNLVSAGGADIFVAKYSAGGVHQWSQRFGAAGTDWGQAIAVDDSSNVIVTGRYWYTVDFGGGNLVSAGSADIFVAKYTAGGVHQWSKRFGNISRDYGDGVAVDASGNVIIVGSFNSTVDFGGGNLVSAGGTDIFAAKYNAGGVHQWSQRFGDTSGEEGHAVAVDASSNVIVTGYFTDTVDFGGGNLISAGITDIFVAKYNAGGVHQWSQRFGGTGGDIGYGITVDASGNVMVTGNFSGTVYFGGINLVSTGSIDIFVAKYNAGGVHQWSQRFGDMGGDEGKAIAVDASGNVIVTGNFRHTVNFGGGNLVSAGLPDVFLAKYSEATGSGVTVSRLAASLGQNFPNPFNPQTTIEYTVTEKTVVSIAIFDVSGTLVTRMDQGSREAGTYLAQWDGRDSVGRPAASGVYLYQLIAPDFTQSKKMVLLK